MSDQGDTGQWRPARSHTGPQSEPDESTGPIPAVSGGGAPAPAFPPVTEQPGGWSAGDDDAPAPGFPGAQTAAPGRGDFRERGPFEPAEPSAGGTSGSTSAVSAVSGVSGAETKSWDQPSPWDEPPAWAEKPVSDEPPSWAEKPVSDEAPAWGETAVSEPPAWAEKPAADEPPAAPEAVSPVPDVPETGGPAAPGFEAAQVDPYDAVDAAHGYEVSDPSLGHGQPPAAPARGMGHGSAAGPAGPVPPNPPAPPVPPGVPGGRAPAAADHAAHADQAAQEAENEFFAPDDDVPAWDGAMAPSGPPPQPGKPSSGNLRLPDWMRDENATASSGGGGTQRGIDYDDFPDEGRSKLPLYAGLGVLLVGLLVAAGVYFLRGGGDGRPARNTGAPAASRTPAASQLPEKTLKHFKGTHTRPIGRVVDQRAGLSYPRLGRPWEPEARHSPMAELGFSVSQFAVTERSGGVPTHWGRLMSAQLGGAERNLYDGPASLHAATTALADGYEARMFGFRHKKKLLASQPLNVGGHQGWLVAYNVTYHHRKGVRATGDVLAVALVDTGKKVPGVLLMSVPNTHRKLWPDVNYVMRELRVI